MTTYPPHVHVIDDEESVRRSLGRLLRAVGIASTGYASAEAFLESYCGTETGCLLVDIRMPGMNGLDLIAELKRRGCPLPAIVMTGHTDEQSMRRLTSLRAVGLLEKPFSLDQLKEILSRAAAPG